ncbi:MAG: hypothetical protein M3457_01205, partial [Chloroflexota bacterium]|nr:hypothetical protein [Chloroflexota bacterium]
ATMTVSWGLAAGHQMRGRPDRIFGPGGGAEGNVNGDLTVYREDTVEVVKLEPGICTRSSSRCSSTPWNAAHRHHPVHGGQRDAGTDPGDSRIDRYGQGRSGCLRCLTWRQIALGKANPSHQALKLHDARSVGSSNTAWRHEGK